MKVIFSIMLFIIMTACSREKPGGAAGTVPASPGPLKTWLALGDSYTIGQGVTAAERFPTQTANSLRLNGINIAIPDYIATTGWTTSNLANAIQAKNPGNYNVVSLLIGVNDQYQTHDTSGYRQRFTSLLVTAIQLANGKKENVFVLSIPDYSVTPFASGNDTVRIRREIDWYNAINKNVTDSFKCPYLDITPSTREARNNQSLLAADGLHPSGLEYRRWADRLVPIMLPVLQ